MGGNNIRIIILDEPYFIAMSSDLTGRLIIQSSDVFIANSFGVVFISCSMQQEQQRECPKNSGKFMVAHKPYDTIFLLGMRPLLKTLQASNNFLHFPVFTRSRTCAHIPCSDRVSSTSPHFRPLLRPSHGLQVTLTTLPIKKEMQTKAKMRFLLWKFSNIFNGLDFMKV